MAGFASSAFSCSLFNICKTQSTYISPIDTVVLNEEREREIERESIICVRRGHVTLLLIKLWSAMTLRMREERYITNIISFVLTAQREKRDLKKKEKEKLYIQQIIPIYLPKLECLHLWHIVLPANALINSFTLRFGSRLNTS